MKAGETGPTVAAALGAAAFATLLTVMTFDPIDGRKFALAVLSVASVMNGVLAVAGHEVAKLVRRATRTPIALAVLTILPAGAVLFGVYLAVALVSSTAGAVVLISSAVFGLAGLVALYSAHT